MPNEGDQGERRARERGAFIPAIECAGLIKRMMFTGADVRLEWRGLDWRGVRSGPVGYIVNEYLITFSKNGDRLSCIDSMMSFDARRVGEAFAWDVNPVDLLTVTERALLIGVLGVIEK